MHTLIVIAHPDKASFTHAVAASLIQGIQQHSPDHTVEINDLIEEGFDPRFDAHDLAYFRHQASPADDVIAQQQRIDRADALVLVYPVYWWSFPGILKGWMDRVFTNGWAYDETPDGKLVKKLQHLQVHLVGVGAASRPTYTRHGYLSAMQTQIDHGIFDYVGAQVTTSALLLTPDQGFPETHLHTARDIGASLFK